MESEAKSIVRDFIERVSARTALDPYELLAPGIVVTINGTTPLSGRFPGLALTRGILVDTARDVIARLSVDIVKCIGTGATLATQLVIRGTTANGRAINAAGDICSCIFRVVDGAITEISLFPDTSAIESVLYRRRYVADAS
jgi:ketosteroid isomerase-like protein